MRFPALLAMICGVLAQDDASHFPLPDGARWVYTSSEGRYNTRIGEPGPMKEGPKRTVQCAVDRESPTLTIFDGSPSPPLRIFVTRDGVYQSSVDPANLILKFPLRKFDDWGPGDRKNGLPRFANHGQREIEVSGIKYLCWRITETRALPKMTRSWTRWYAPGAGLVSEEMTEEAEGGVTKRLYELESFEKTPPRK